MISPRKNSKYFLRSIDNQLDIWAESPDRKPLLIRGARQVGKSSSIRHLGQRFSHFLEVNFELSREAQVLFLNFQDPFELIERLSLLFNTPVIEGRTLLFLDEVQACPEALSSLRFFYEKMPGLHVVATGSLLEFALAELPSFGVGRIRSLFMYPFSFEEFLMASGESGLVGWIQKAHALAPMEAPFHQKLENYFRVFLAIGGMPEVVAAYLNGRPILEIQSVLDDLLISYQTDFATYKKRVPSSRIQEVFNSVVFQMGGKFVFSKGGLELNNRQVKEALDLLILARLVIPVTHSSANGLPLGAEINPNKQKMLLLDTGLFQRLLGLNVAEILLSEDFQTVNKGAIAELYVGLEWLKSRSPFQSEQLYYWSRESGKGNAEVDYVIPSEGQVVPIEVKSSGSGSMQSMFVFLKEKGRQKGIRVSLENFGQVGSVEIVPLYAFGIKMKGLMV